MVDRGRRSKAAFWTTALLLAGAAAVPSGVLVRTVKKYRDFVTGFQPPVLRQTKTKATPHQGNGQGRLHFVAFRLRAEKAREVEVVGDFNRWRRGTLPLQKLDDQWEVLLPLPAGRYRYQFIVDGEPAGQPEWKKVP